MKLSHILLNLLPVTIVGAGFVTRPCYCQDSCLSYIWTEGISWQEGKCFNFNPDASAFSLDSGGGYCRIYNQKDCKGDMVETSCSYIPGKEDPIKKCCRNSAINWLKSAQCWS
jgi:hypothetical protein